MMNSWKSRVWKARPNGFRKLQSMIVLDSAPFHLKKTVLSSFKQHYNTDVGFIPGGMTPLLQPVDVHWNKSFKTAMKEKCG